MHYCLLLDNSKPSKHLEHDIELIHSKQAGIGHLKHFLFSVSK